jgi:hypothetical protein
VGEEVAAGGCRAQDIEGALGSGRVVERAKLAGGESAVVAGHAARQGRRDDGAGLGEQRRIAAEHELAEQALEEVAIALEHAAGDRPELVAAVVELDAVDDLDPLGAIGDRIEADELTGVATCTHLRSRSLSGDGKP